MATDDWADSCNNATVVSPTGQYSGTLGTSDDRDHFKIQLNRGEYLTVEATVPTDASLPEIDHTGDFTLRTGSNTTLVRGETIQLDPGITGTYEVWAESDTTICFDVHEEDTDAGYPYSWDVSPTKTNPGITDQWGNNCSNASVVDPTGYYDGTLITPTDRDHFKIQLNQGESFSVEATVPTDASLPEIDHTGDFTLRTGSNTTLVRGETIQLDPGITGTYEVEADSDTTICFDVHEEDTDAGYPYGWNITLGNPPEPTQIGLRFETTE